MAGRIAGYGSDGKPLDPRIENAFPGKPNDPLVLEGIEQGVQQIQRLRRYQAEVRILPGQSPNTSLVDLMLTETKPWWLQVAADNQGAPETGRARGRATVSLDNTLGFLESIGLTYLRSSRSEVGIASIAVPYGYNTWSASYAASRYRQDLPFDLEEKGGSYTATLAWNRVLHLSAAGRDSVDVSLTSNDSWRKIGDVRLRDERLTVLRGSLVGLRQGNGWRAWGEADVARGLSWMGAIDDPGSLDSRAPHAQFTKFEAHGGLIYVPAADLGQYTSQIDAQTSPVGLYGIEQFRLGGFSSVRGYDEGTMSGDRGVLVRQEWAMKPFALDAVTARATPLVFVDAGWTKLVESATTRLVGAGAGLRFTGNKWGADFFLAKPISSSSNVNENSWHFYAALRIDL